MTDRDRRTLAHREDEIRVAIENHREHRTALQIAQQLLKGRVEMRERIELEDAAMGGLVGMPDPHAAFRPVARDHRLEMAKLAHRAAQMDATGVCPKMPIMPSLIAGQAWFIQSLPPSSLLFRHPKRPIT